MSRTNRLLALLTVLVALAWPTQAAAQARTRLTSGANLPTNCTAGTDVFAKTGTGAGVYRCASTDTWVLLISASNLGTGVQTALAVNVGSAGAFVVLNGAGGTPSAINLANGVALPPAGVTFAATDRFLCRDTASGGAGEECTGANAAAIIGLSNILALYTGTPTGSKFLRDDGSWQAIAGGGDALVANGLNQFTGTATTAITCSNSCIVKTDTTTAHTLKIQGYDVNGTAYVDFITITNGDTPTMDLAAGTTIGGQAPPLFTPAGGTALEPLYYDNNDGLLKAFTTSLAVTLGTIEVGAASDTTIARASAGKISVEGVNVVTTSSTDTLTNKTYDVEGTGNVFTDVGVWSVSSAVIQGSTASGGYSCKTGLCPTATDVSGSNVPRAWARYPDSDGEFEQVIEVLLTSDFTGTMDVKGVWKTAATGNVVIQVQWACSGDAEALNDTWSSASTVTEAAGTSGQANSWEVTGVTITGCAANEVLSARVMRQRTHASDSLNGVWDNGPFNIYLRRAK